MKLMQNGKDASSATAHVAKAANNGEKKME